VDAGIALATLTAVAAMAVMAAMAGGTSAQALPLPGSPPGTAVTLG
jgi:hypothetical protein